MAKTTNRRPTDAETRLQRMADFVQDTLEKLNVGYKGGRITKDMYNKAKEKLNSIVSVLKENEELWNEVIFADEYAKEADRDVKKQVADTIREYDEYVKELTADYNALIETIKENNQTNINKIYKEFSNQIANLETTYNVATIQKRFSDLNNKIKGLEGQLEDAKAENVVLKENLVKTQQKSADKTRQIQGNAKVSFKTQDSLSRAQATIKKQKLELQDVKDALEESLSEINKRDARIKELARELEETQDSARRGSIKVQKLQAQIKVLQDQVDDLNRGIEVLETQYPEYLEEIKKSICQQTICEKFGLSEDQKVGFARAEGLYKARKKAKKDKTYDEKIKQTVNSLKENYPSNWFKNTTNEDVEKVLNNTVSKIPARVKKAIVCGIASALLVAGGLGIGLGGRALTYKSESAQKGEALKAVQSEVVDANQTKNELQGIVSGLQHTNAKQEEEKKEKDSTIKKQDSTIKEQDSTIKEQDSTIKEQESTIKDQEEVIEEQTGIIDDLTKENEGLKEELAVPEIQTFDIDGSVFATKTQLESVMNGTLQHVDIMYNSETGNIVVVAKAKKGKNEKLMIGTGTIAQGSDYTKKGSDLIDNQIKNVTFGDVYVKDGDAWYKVSTQKAEDGYTASAKACVYEVSEYGIISIKESGEITIAINSEDEEEAIKAAKEVAATELEKQIGTATERE